MSTAPLHMTEAYASRFVTLALAHVSREFPNKLDHVMLNGEDVKSPRELHPIFFGSFDWHSCVHGYWLLARVYRRYPHLPQAEAIKTLFNERITNANVDLEVQYAAHPERAGFERPYGWAWLLQLSAELKLHTSHEGRGWADTLAPLAAVFSNRFQQFLPKATYPIRVGTHFNSAFAVVLAMQYAEHDHELSQTLRSAALRWFTTDANAPAWEPGGDDFLSETLVEAACMRSVMPPEDFTPWFESFLPHVASRLPATLFTPAIVSDRRDGKIGHLDGLNLSRAWCWRLLAEEWPANDARSTTAHEAANEHLLASLPHVAGDYMGEHWLATYAMLALDADVGRRMSR